MPRKFGDYLTSYRDWNDWEDYLEYGESEWSKKKVGIMLMKTRQVKKNVIIYAKSFRVKL